MIPVVKRSELDRPLESRAENGSSNMSRVESQWARVHERPRADSWARNLVASTGLGLSFPTRSPAHDFRNGWSNGEEDAVVD